MWTLQLKKGENILAEINNIPDNVSEETIFDLYGNLNDQLESFLYLTYYGYDGSLLNKNNILTIDYDKLKELKK
ncbi:MAG TPA: hypothetical protein PKY44_07380 [Bacteroidales bacterium]|nr:hypothetical protein [Bacteroidales bacterium]